MSTPVQKQYTRLKAENPDHLLFFRLGDFYELFFEDAIIATKVLGITLTARHKGTENEMPMAGFPHHSHQEYLETLINAGYRVAIAEQFTQDDGSITRKIDRTVTPALTLESGTLEADQNNFLATIYQNPKAQEYALAYYDISTGDFQTALFSSQEKWLSEISKIKPKEIILSELDFQDPDLTALLPNCLLLPQPFPKPQVAQKKLKDQFPANHLSVVGIDKLEILWQVCAQILNHLEKTKAKTDSIESITRYHPEQTMTLDAVSWQHLEIFQPLQQSDTPATLHSIFSKPQTAMGGRQLRHWMLQPSLDKVIITQRQNATETLIENASTLNKIIDDLTHIYDLERILARIDQGRGNARDLVFIRESLKIFPTLKNTLETFDNAFLKSLATQINLLEDLTTTLSNALEDQPPLEITNGGMIKPGFNSRLDALKELHQEAHTWLEKFLENTKSKTGLSNLRLKFSKNFGYCLEISKAQAELAPSDWIRRQTLVNAERFTTDKLAEFETKVLSAESESFSLEHELFIQLRDKLTKYSHQIRSGARAIAVIDALCAFARTAQNYRWCKPTIVEATWSINIKNGRHPVVEALSNTPFIPNHLIMTGESNRFHLISGPNMAGKSTFLRQNALIIYLNQIGSYVPAEGAELGIFDRVFTRVGASDHLAAGKSTFFVEMTETAQILHNATERSFVILDEIGRGTSTFDGISLAWAITEHLHDSIKAPTLFATHYHELIDLAEELIAAKNFHVSVSQNKSGIVFLRQIKPGGMSDSFGIEVAKLAGIPKTVTAQARVILKRLESESLLSGKPNLFSLDVSTPPETLNPSKSTLNKGELIFQFLENINPDELSPKEALEKLYEVKKKFDESDL